MERAINFIENPEELSRLDMDQIRGGYSEQASASCSVHCTGSSCNARSGAAQEELSVC